MHLIIHCCDRASVFIVIMIFVSKNKHLKQFLMFNFSLKCYIDEFIWMCVKRNQNIYIFIYFFFFQNEANVCSWK